MILTASIMDTIKYGPCITVLTKSTKKIYPKEKIQKENIQRLSGDVRFLGYNLYRLP